jgi:hypothetical protein
MNYLNGKRYIPLNCLLNSKKKCFSQDVNISHKNAGSLWRKIHSNSELQLVLGITHMSILKSEKNEALAIL